MGEVYSKKGYEEGSVAYFVARDLITPAGKMAQLWVPRDWEGTFLTEVFARYKRMTGEVAVHLG
jgi:transposase-like protein